MNISLQSIVESQFLPFVEKPFRYIGNELNCVRKDLSRIALHGVLCFPEVYDIGMSHSGIQILYHIVNARPSWALSRCFNPWDDAERIMREKKIPLYCLEYLLPLSQADWLGFSVQYELQYTNIVNMLDMGGVPLYGKNRGEGHPLVIAGGPCMNNPEPIADFIDAFVIGDGEETITTLCACMETCKQDGVSRARTLELMAAIPGVYVPALYPAKTAGLFACPDMSRGLVRAAKVAELSDAAYPDKPLVPLIEVVHHRLAVEVMRGCTRGCRFCAAGYYYRPVRERAPEAVRDQLERSFLTTGWRDVGLLSLSTADYSDFPELLRSVTELMRKRHMDVSIPSTRIDALTDEQLTMLDAISPATSFTIAPEAGSRRLRRAINKDFSDEAIFAAVDSLMQRNIQTLKLYFMIGLPTETAEDIDALISLAEAIADKVLRRSRRRAVNVSISPFSPKAQTPFQWEAMDSVEQLAEKSRYIKQRLSRKPNVKVSYREPAMTLLETIMARGDRRLCPVIEAAWRKGARSDGWAEHFNIGLWRATAQEAGVDLELYAGAIPLDQPLPWRAVSTGVSEAFLRDERARALEGVSGPDCRTGECCGCGLCDEKIKKRILPRTEPVAGDAPPAETPPPLPQEREPQFYCRVKYVKNGLMRFLGNRDMMNIFHRAFTASQFPLAFSKGFHPSPRISFGPPLPFGVMGEAEAMDTVTLRPITPEMFDGVNLFLPRGLRIIDSATMNIKEDSLTSVIEAAHYTIYPFFTETAESLTDIVCKAIASPDIVVTSAREASAAAQPGKNIRPMIKHLKVINNGQAAGIEAVLSLSPGATCRPADLIAALFPNRLFADFLISRTACLKTGAGSLIPIV